MKRKIALFLAICMLAITAAACAGDEAEGADRPSRSELIIAQPDIIDVLDPHYSHWLRNMRVVHNIFESLLRQDEQGNLVPGLATSWTLSDCALIYTFILREGVYFHNGDPFTSADAVFSFERAMGSPFAGQAADQIRSVRAIDDFTFEVTMEFVYTAQPPFFASLFLAIVNQRVLEEQGDDFSINPGLSGTGAYMFSEFHSGSHVVLVANENYWGQVPSIRTVTFKTISEESAGAIALEAGEIDVYLGLLPQDADLLEGGDAVVIHRIPSFFCEFISLNVENEFLSDRRVRKAIALSVCKDELVMAAVDGAGVPTGSLVSPPMFGWDSTIRPYPRDLDRARQLLAEAGHEGGGFSLRILTTAGWRSRIAEVYQAALRDLGITASVYTLELAAFNEAGINGTGDIFVMGYTSLAADADPIMNTALSEHNVGLLNFARWVHPEFERLLAASRGETNEDLRREMLIEMQQLIYYEVPIVPSYFRMTINGVNPALRNFTGEAHNLFFLNKLSW